jgi:hypothetical protein
MQEVATGLETPRTLLDFVNAMQNYVITAAAAKRHNFIEFGENQSIFRRNTWLRLLCRRFAVCFMPFYFMTYSSTLNMEAICSS